MQTESVNNSVVYEPIAGLYRLRFDDDVAHPSYYRFEIEALQRATENDRVSITINTDGGSLATGIEFTNEILQCKAPVHGTLRANCHSCGSIVFLACDSHEVGIASEMLLHSGGGGTGGTPAQSVKRAESYKRQVRALFETVYKGFVTDEELDLMIEHDKEYIFSAEEIKERLEIMHSYRQQQQESSLEDLFSEQNSENEKYEMHLLAELEKNGEITPEEKEIAMKVRNKTFELDETLSDEDYERIVKEQIEDDYLQSTEDLGDSLEEESLCKFQVKRVVDFKDVNGEIWEIGLNEDKIVLEGDLLEELKEMEDGKSLCKILGVKLPYNIKSEDKIWSRLETHLRKIWEEATI